jgi:dihydroorotate dehydrogenase (fumarate)
MIDLSTTYMGLELKNPIVASASPLCDSVDNIRRLEDHGIAAVVLPSLFEEQLVLDSESVDMDLSRGSNTFSESSSFLPELGDYNLGPEGYLELIRKAKKHVSIPVIASLNGVTPGGWVRYAREMEEAGADAIELNIYSLVTDASRTAAEVEKDYCALVRNLRENLKIPIAVKLSHFFSAFANFASYIDTSGANALVLFNRFYQPDLDINQQEVVPSLTLSHPSELLLRLHWTAVLYGHISADIAVTGGVHRAEDVLKSLMAGASVAMMTSALLQNGVAHLDTVLAGILQWMEEHEYESTNQMRGSMSRRSVPDPALYERANYMRVLSSYAMRSSVTRNS